MMAPLTKDESDRLATSNKKMEQLLYALLQTLDHHIERGSKCAKEIQDEAFERVLGGDKRD